jgi:D-lyxose ketol-isomerase
MGFENPESSRPELIFCHPIDEPAQDEAPAHTERVMVLLPGVKVFSQSYPASVKMGTMTVMRGILEVKLQGANEALELDPDQPVSVIVDNVQRMLPPQAILYLNSEQRIILEPGVYYELWPMGGPCALHEEVIGNFNNGRHNLFASSNVEWRLVEVTKEDTPPIRWLSSDLPKQRQLIEKWGSHSCPPLG